MDYLGKSKWKLDSPCLVVDTDILDSNIRKMRKFAAATGKRLRPHAKTHKCPEIAKRQLSAGAVGICVAKVSEASSMINAGITKILITSPVVSPQKISRLINCAGSAPELMTVVDNPENAKALNQAAHTAKLNLKVLIDLETPMGRTGIPHAKALELGKFIGEMSNLELKGLQCYAGKAQHIKSFEERQQFSLSCMEKAAACFRQFKDAGLPVEILTGSGTGTYEIDAQIQEITDFQVGSYVLMDTEYLNIGGRENPERYDTYPPSLSLLARVISVNQPEFVTIDAGLKAVYHHGDIPEITNKPGLSYDWFGDEHGKVSWNASGQKPELGTVLELIVSHCDPTINLYDRIFVVKDEIVIDCWEISLRGKSR